MSKETTATNIPKRCILTGAELTKETDSKAHVIPSALGGRLKPKGILSKDANNELDDKFDNELITAYQPFMVLVAGIRDRSGDLAPIQASDENGRPYRIGVDEIKPGSHEFIEEILPDGRKNYSIKATSRRQMRELLGRVKKDNPNLDIDEVMQSTTVLRQPVGKLNFQMQFGPISTFPAIYVMASVFAAHCGLAPHPEFVSYVNNFDVNSRSLPPDTFYFLPEQTWLSNSAKVGHSLVLLCDSRRAKAIFYAQLFNQPGIAVVLPYGAENICCFSYGVDVMEGVEIAVSVDEALLSSLDWKETHVNGDPRLWKEVELRSGPLLAIAHQRSFDSSTNEILRRYFASNPGAQITAADVQDASRELAELMMRRLYPRATF